MGAGAAASCRGIHQCELCRDDQATLLSKRGDRYVRGNGALYIPTADCVYIGPLMIVHYVREHSYRPPEEFMAAVLECPAQGSADYLALIGSFRTNEFDDLEFDRSGEGRRIAELKAAGLWTERGMCPRCGTWLYRYGKPPLGSHCGEPFVNVRTREEEEEEARLDEERRRKRDPDRLWFSLRHVVEFVRSLFSRSGERT